MVDRRSVQIAWNVVILVRSATHRQLICLAPLVSPQLHDFSDFHNLHECTADADFDCGTERCVLCQAMESGEFSTESWHQIGCVHLFIIQKIVVGWVDLVSQGCTILCLRRHVGIRIDG